MQLYQEKWKTERYFHQSICSTSNGKDNCAKMCMIIAITRTGRMVSVEQNLSIVIKDVFQECKWDGFDCDGSLIG